MSTRYVCIADATGQTACILKKDAGGLKYVSGTPGAERKVSPILHELIERGVLAREEQFSRGHIDVDMVKVGSEDPRYLEACATEFSARGWSAKIYARPVADIWRKLYVLPVPQELRASLAERLDAIPYEALEELETHLDTALADFEKLATQHFS